MFHSIVCLPLKHGLHFHIEPQRTDLGQTAITHTVLYLILELNENSGRLLFHKDSNKLACMIMSSMKVHVFMLTVRMLCLAYIIPEHDLH